MLRLKYRSHSHTCSFPHATPRRAPQRIAKAYGIVLIQQMQISSGSSNIVPEYQFEALRALDVVRQFTD